LRERGRKRGRREQKEKGRTEEKGGKEIGGNKKRERKGRKASPPIHISGYATHRLRL